LPVLVMVPRCFRFPLESSLGPAPLYPINCRALSNREIWPNSDTIVTAEILRAILAEVLKGLVFLCQALS
jgi:hypothetical protein